MLTIIMTSEIAMVFASFVLEARLVIKTEIAAKSTSNMMFRAISGKVVSGLSIKVMPSTMRKIATINRLRMITSTVFERFSTFLTVLSRFGFFGIILLSEIWYTGRDKISQSGLHITITKVNFRSCNMVHREGFEPTTPCSEDKCSNPLSYRCMGLLYHILRDFGSGGL